RAAALLLEQLLGLLDVRFDAGHVRVDLERPAPVLDRLVVLLELEVDLAVAREGAEVERGALHHFAAIGERAPEIAAEKIRRGALVPALGEGRLAADDLAVHPDGLVQAGGPHELGAPRAQAGGSRLRTPAP